MFPTLSPAGVSRLGTGGAGVQSAEGNDLSKVVTREDLDTVFRSVEQYSSIRFANGESLYGYLYRKRDSFLTMRQRSQLRGRNTVTNHRGVKGAFEKLLESRCKTIRKFLSVWTWIDTVLALGFPEETASVSHFKVQWWIIAIHEVTSTNSVHTVSKKWGKFSLFLQLHYGGAVTPMPQWESWFPALPKGTWMDLKPEQLSQKERAYCRILSDKRGLPAGDFVTKKEALEKHLAALTKGNSLTKESRETLINYSEIAASEILRCVPDRWFQTKSGHVSVSNSSCYEATRSMGGKRTWVLSCLKAWLLEAPMEPQDLVLPSGELIVEISGVPRWKTVKPPGYPEARDLPGGLKTITGLFTEDFADGEQERVGFQLFSWSFFTLCMEGYLNRDGSPTGKPMPVTRTALGEPGCKVRIATKSKAAFIVYGQPFAHAMRELLESHPALRAGLGSGYQLHEWLKLSKGKPLPRYVMVGDFESATDNIEHEAGIISTDCLLTALRCDRNSYAKNYIRLLLSPREITEKGVVTTTNSGCLMGEPGTKVILTFLALVANCYARGSGPGPLFATAGDDQIDADDDLEIMKRYAEASKVTTMVPSMEKWGVFQYSTLYCQQLLDVRESTEISVPKPRLLSPETKSSHGDDEINPSFGKASQLSKEMSWSPYKDLCNSMTLMFLRNMRRFIEYKPEIFIPKEWGGLGLTGPKASLVASMLPLPHRNLILHREQGSEKAGKILARWSTSRNFSRGISIEDDDEPLGELFEYLPQASIHDVTDNMPVETRFRERLKQAKREGWIPVHDLLRAIHESRAYASIWDHRNEKISRGYKSLPWGVRTKRMHAASLDLPILDGIFPQGPRWQECTVILVEGVGFQFSTEFAGEEEGEIVERMEILPGVGSHAQPRLFLHYDNHRLLTNATSR